MGDNNTGNNPQKLKLEGRVEVNEPCIEKNSLENAPDADTARKASADERNRALDANPDKHTGSAGGKAGTIEIVHEADGKTKVLASRHVDRKEKELNLEGEPVHRMSEEELHSLAKSGDFAAVRMAERLSEAKSQEEKQAVLKESDGLFPKGKKSGESAQVEGKEEETINQLKHPTRDLAAIEADKSLPEDKRNLARDLQSMRAVSKELGQSTDVIDQYAAVALNVEIAKKNVIPEDLNGRIVHTLIKSGIDDLKVKVGILHGTANFVVNTLAGVGNAVRMAAAAEFEMTPLARVCPEIYADQEGRKMLHETIGAIAKADRIGLQLCTTFNPESPLYGVEFDPEGAAEVRRLAQTLPKAISERLVSLSKADPEVQATVGTEAALNIASLFLGPEVMAAKGGADLNAASKVLRTGEELVEGAELAKVAEVTGVEGSASTPIEVAKALNGNVMETSNIFSKLAEAKPVFKSFASKLEEQANKLKQGMEPLVAYDLQPQLAGFGAGGRKVNVLQTLVNVGDRLNNDAEQLVNFMIGKKFWLKEPPDFAKLDAVERAIRLEIKEPVPGIDISSGSKRALFANESGELLNPMQIREYLNTNWEKLKNATGENLRECGLIRFAPEEADLIMASRLEKKCLKSIAIENGKITAASGEEAADHARKLLETFDVNLGKKNLAIFYLETDAEPRVFVSLSQGEPVIGTLPKPEPMVYQPSMAKPITRGSDSEFKGVELYSRPLLDGKRPIKSIKILTEQDPCEISCGPIIEMFKEKFPDVPIEVTSLYKTQQERIAAVKVRMKNYKEKYGE